MKQSQKAFLNWLKKYDPTLHAVFIRKLKLANVASGLSAIEVDENQSTGLFDKVANSFSSAFDKITTALASGMETYNKFRVEKSVIDTQLNRAKANLMPKKTVVAVNPAPTAEDAQLIKKVAEKSLALSPQFDIQGSLIKSLPVLIGAGILWGMTSKKKGG